MHVVGVYAAVIISRSRPRFQLSGVADLAHFEVLGFFAIPDDLIQHPHPRLRLARAYLSVPP